MSEQAIVGAKVDPEVVRSHAVDDDFGQAASRGIDGAAPVLPVPCRVGKFPVPEQAALRTVATPTMDASLVGVSAPVTIRVPLKFVVCWNDDGTGTRDAWWRRVRNGSLTSSDPNPESVLMAVVSRVNASYSGSGDSARNAHVVFEFTFNDLEHVDDSVLNHDWKMPPGSHTDESKPPLTTAEMEAHAQRNHIPREAYARRYPGQAVIMLMDGDDLIWDATATTWVNTTWGGGISDINMSYVRTHPNILLHRSASDAGNHLAHELGHFFSVQHPFDTEIGLTVAEATTLPVADRIERLKSRHVDAMTAFMAAAGNADKDPELAFDNDHAVVSDTPPDSASDYFNLLQPDSSKPFLAATFDLGTTTATLKPDRFNAMGYYQIARASHFSPGQVAQIRGAFSTPLRSHLLPQPGGLPLLFFNRDNGQYATGRLHGDGRFNHVFASEPGALAAWTHVVGAGNGALLFFNRNNGQYATGRLHGDGSFNHVFASEPGALAAWTHVVGAGNGALPLLFFNRDNGQYATGRLHGDGRFNHVFASEPGALAAWTHVVGAGNGALLFFNRNNGQYATGRLHGDGSFNHVFASEPGALAAWTHVVGAGNGALLFFNRNNGQYATGRLHGDGRFNHVFASEPGALAAWTHVVGAGNGALLFFNRNNGQYATGRLHGDGRFNHVFASQPGKLGAWTHIADSIQPSHHSSTPHNGAVLFYDQAAGQWATATLRSDGSFDHVFTSEPASMTTNWTHLVGGNGAVLFYDQAAGQWATATLRSDGRFDHVFTSEPASMTTNWTHLVGGANGAVLFYDQAAGQWATATLRSDGSFDHVFTSEPASMTTNWTHLVGGANGAVLFYDQAAGQWATATLRSDGRFDHVFTSEPASMTTNWTHLVGGANGAVLFYDQAAGQWATATLRSDGSFDHVFTSEPASMTTNWTHLVGGANGAVLFYDQAAGQWATATLRSDGSFDHVFTSEPASMTTNWTHLA